MHGKWFDNVLYCVTYMQVVANAVRILLSSRYLLLSLIWWSHQFVHSLFSLCAFMGYNIAELNTQNVQYLGGKN